jgi:hypothetical protein
MNSTFLVQTMTEMRRRAACKADRAWSGRYLPVDLALGAGRTGNWYCEAAAGGGFFTDAFGFLISRLLRFCPLAMRRIPF